MSIVNSENIICGICKKHIEKIDKKKIVVSREAYWTDAGIFTLQHTREFYHKECLEDAIQNYTEKYWDV